MANKLNNTEITLISASDTGAMIVTALMILFNSAPLTEEIFEVSGQHLLHIGPRFNYNMNGLPLSELEGNKYIYIFDFMCEGSEYKQIGNCIKMGKAEFLGAIGIAKYNYPRYFNALENKNKISYISENIEFLVDLEKWNEGDEGYYKISYKGEIAC